MKQLIRDHKEGVIVFVSMLTLGVMLTAGVMEFKAQSRRWARKDAQQYSGRQNVLSAKLYLFQARIEIQTDKGVISLPTSHPDAAPFTMPLFFGNGVYADHVTWYMPKSIDVDVVGTVPRAFDSDGSERDVADWQNGSYMRITSFEN